MKLTALISLAVALALNAATAQAAPGWSSPRTVGSSESKARNPLAVVDGANRATVVWESKGGRRQAIRVASETSAGSFGQTKQISKTRELDPRLSSVVGNSAGEVLATWCSMLDGVPVVRVGVGRTGAGITEGQVLATVFLESCADAAINSRGDAVVAWIGDRLPQFSYRPAGGKFGPAVTVAAHYSDASVAPAVAIDEAGNAQVVWADKWDNGFRLAHIERSSDGVVGAPSTISPPHVASKAAIELASDGSIAAIWADESTGAVSAAAGSVTAGLGGGRQIGVATKPTRLHADVAAGERAGFSFATESQDGCQRNGYGLASNWRAGALDSQSLAGLPKSEAGIRFEAQALGLTHGPPGFLVSWLETQRENDGCEDVRELSSYARAAVQPTGQQLTAAQNVSDPRYPASDLTLNYSIQPTAAWKCFDGRKYRVQVASFGSVAGNPEWCGAEDARRPRVRVRANRYPVRWRSQFRSTPRARCNEQCNVTLGLLLFSAGSKAVKLGVSETTLKPSRRRLRRLEFPSLSRRQVRRIRHIVRTRRNARFVFRLRFDDLALNSRLLTRHVYLRP